MNDQVDMSQFIAARSDQLNADDLMNSPKTITITKVTATPDSAEQPVSIHYEGGQGKVFKPCKTVRRIMVGVWGADAAKYVGRSMTLYRDPTVAFGGMQVGGIRVSHMSHIDGDKTVALLVTRGRKAPFKVKPLLNAPAAASTGDAAENWTNTYIGKLQAASDLAAVADLENAQAARLSELKEKRPELHERIAAAAEARRGQLAEPERPTEPDPNTNDLAPTLKRIADAFSLREVDALDKETEGDRTFLTDDQVALLDEAFAKRRAELRESETA